MDSIGIVLSPRHESMIEMHIPENVKLWESPGRAGGLPDCNYCDQEPQLDQTIGVLVEPSLLQTSFLKWVLLKKKWMNHCIGWSY